MSGMAGIAGLDITGLGGLQIQYKVGGHPPKDSLLPFSNYWPDPPINHHGQQSFYRWLHDHNCRIMLSSRFRFGPGPFARVLLPL